MPGDEARPDPAGRVRSMAQLAQQMREMAESMLTGGVPGWPIPGAIGSGGTRGTQSGATTPPRGRPPSERPAAGAAGRPAGPPPGLPAIPGMPPMPGLSATPATLSAQQLQAVVDDIAARRSQVQALVAQLTAFDEQLSTLETSLRPLLQWLRTWSDLEGAVTDFWMPRPPAS